MGRMLGVDLDEEPLWMNEMVDDQCKALAAFGVSENNIQMTSYFEDGIHTIYHINWHVR